MNNSEIKKWINNNLVMQDEARSITSQSKTAFNQSVQNGKIQPFVEFGTVRKTRLYLKEDLELYRENKRIRGGNVPMKFEDLDEMNSTIIEWEGMELRTTQDPYVAADGDTYKASAVDEENNEYNVIWEITDYETSDESDACNWDEPIKVIKL